MKWISKQGKSKKDLASFKAEMSILQRLRHPNIISMLDAIETEEQFIVVTEYAQGELYQVLELDLCLPEDVVQKIGSQLVQALHYLHSNRVVHRDLKPQNILIGSRGLIKLCDFGFARAMSTQSIVLTSIKGTPLYMAPELVREEEYNHTVDLWSLGVILYELFWGAAPFYTNNLYTLMAHITKNAVKYDAVQVRSLTNGTTVEVYASDTFRDFLRGLLQKDPTKRLAWPHLLQHAFVAGIEVPYADDAAAYSPSSGGGFGFTCGAKVGDESYSEAASAELESDHPDGGILTPISAARKQRTSAVVEERMASPAERLRMYRDSVVGGGRGAEKDSYLQRHIARRSVLAAESSARSPAASSMAEKRGGAALGENEEGVRGSGPDGDAGDILEPESESDASFVVEERAPLVAAQPDSAAAAPSTSTRDWNSPRDEEEPELNEKKAARPVVAVATPAGARDDEYAVSGPPAVVVDTHAEEADESLVTASSESLCSVWNSAELPAGLLDDEQKFLGLCMALFRRELASDPLTLGGNSGSWDRHSLLKRLVNALAPPSSPKQVESRDAAKKLQEVRNRTRRAVFDDARFIELLLAFVRAVCGAGDAASARLGDAVAVLNALARASIGEDVRVAVCMSLAVGGRQGAEGTTRWWWSILVETLVIASQVSPELDFGEELRASTLETIRLLLCWGHADALALSTNDDSSTQREVLMRASLFDTLLTSSCAQRFARSDDVGSDGDDGDGDGDDAVPTLQEVLGTAVLATEDSAALRSRALRALCQLVHPLPAPSVPLEGVLYPHYGACAGAVVPPAAHLTRLAAFRQRVCSAVALELLRDSASKAEQFALALVDRVALLEARPLAAISRDGGAAAALSVAMTLARASAEFASCVSGALHGGGDASSKRRPLLEALVQWLQRPLPRSTATDGALLREPRALRVHALGLRLLEVLLLHAGDEHAAACFEIGVHTLVSATASATSYSGDDGGIDARSAPLYVVACAAASLAGKAVQFQISRCSSGEGKDSESIVLHTLALASSMEQLRTIETHAALGTLVTRWRAKRGGLHTPFDGREERGDDDGRAVVAKWCAVEGTQFGVPTHAPLDGALKLTMVASTPYLRAAAAAAVATTRVNMPERVVAAVRSEATAIRRFAQNLFSCVLRITRFSSSSSSSGSSSRDASSSSSNPSGGSASSSAVGRSRRDGGGGGAGYGGLVSLHGLRRALKTMERFGRVGTWALTKDGGDDGQHGGGKSMLVVVPSQHARESGSRSGAVMNGGALLCATIRVLRPPVVRRIIAWWCDGRSDAMLEDVIHDVVRIARLPFPPAMQAAKANNRDAQREAIRLLLKEHFISHLVNACNTLVERVFATLLPEKCDAEAGAEADDSDGAALDDAVRLRLRSIIAPSMSIIAQLAFLSENIARQFARADGIAFIKRSRALTHGRHPVTVDALRLLSHLARYSPEWYEEVGAVRFDRELTVLIARPSSVAAAKGGGGVEEDKDSLLPVVCNVIGNMCRHGNTLHPMLLRVAEESEASSSSSSLFGRVVELLSSEDSRVRRAACIAVGNAAFHYSPGEVRCVCSFTHTHIHSLFLSLSLSLSSHTPPVLLHTW